MPWAGEHLLTPGFHFFPQLALLCRLAADTNGMAMGTNVVLLPGIVPSTWPSRWRCRTSCAGAGSYWPWGRDIGPEEFAAMGVPFEERVQRLVEGVEVMRRLWTEDEVTLEGSCSPWTAPACCPSRSVPAARPPGWVRRGTSSTS